MSGRPRQRRLVLDWVWLIRLRWVAVCGQCITIFAARWLFELPLQLLPLLCIVAVTALSNGLISSEIVRLARRNARAADRSWQATTILALDIVALTGLLYFSGGTSNPFAIFYLVNLTLAAVVLSPQWSWILASLAILCFSILQVTATTDAEFARRLAAPVLVGIPLGELGRLVAYSTCSLVLVYFATRLTTELQLQENELRELERQRAQVLHTESLGTLAAGAGHELATPLSTIAVVANELSRWAEGQDLPQDVRDDVGLIRQEVEHCRVILERMTSNLTGGHDPPARCSLTQLLDQVLGEFSERHRVKLELQVNADAVYVKIARHSVAQAIRGILQNALDATFEQVAASGDPESGDPESGETGNGETESHERQDQQQRSTKQTSKQRGSDELIQLRLMAKAGGIAIQVIDHGPGMSADVLQRVTDPFFTTKEPGKGMGLGLFLVRSTIERADGRLQFASTLGAGTTVEVWLPTSKPT